MKKNKFNKLNIYNDKIWVRIKKSIFHKELYNQRSITFKIAASTIFLALSIGLSLIEIFSIPTPWGIIFDLRFFDTLVIIYSIAIIGLNFALLEGIILPWIHNLIDGCHIWLEMMFFMISNILIIFITWFIYYILFNAYNKFAIPENIKNHNIHEYHYIKKIHDHHHKIVNIRWIKKLLAFIIIIPICSLIETTSFLIVTKILTNTNKLQFNTNYFQIIKNEFIMLISTIDISKNIFYLSQNKETLFYISNNNYYQNSNVILPNLESQNHILFFLIIFFSIFTFKYILNTILFLLLEQRTRQLVDKYGIYV